MIEYTNIKKYQLFLLWITLSFIVNIYKFVIFKDKIPNICWSQDLKLLYDSKEYLWVLDSWLA